jgi:hypothetical protein
MASPALRDLSPQTIADGFMATDGNIPLIAERFGLTEAEVQRALVESSGVILSWLRLKSATLVFDTIRNTQEVFEARMTDQTADGGTASFLKLLTTMSELTRMAPTTTVINNNNNIVNNLMNQLPPATRDSVQRLNALSDEEFDNLEEAFEEL